MAERIAKFEYVSREQYRKDFLFQKGMLCSDTDTDVDTIYDSLKLPKRATKASAGYDIYTPVDIKLAPGESLKIPTGIRVKMREDYFLMIVPRSGLGSKFRFQLNNTTGVIDSDYYDTDNEGHIFVPMINDSREGKILEIKAGTAFAQGIFLNYGITVDDEATDTRNGGFGSTS